MGIIDRRWVVGVLCTIRNIPEDGVDSVDLFACDTTLLYSSKQLYIGFTSNIKEMINSLP